MNSLTRVDLGHCSLALPHNTFATIENISDAVPDKSDAGSYWQLQRGQHHWALLALDQDMQPQALLPSQHRLALCLKHLPVALSCLRIETLQQPQITPLPAMMKKSGSLIQGLILDAGSVVLLVDPAALSQRLQQQLESGLLQTAFELSTTAERMSCNVLPGA